ncbi:MAG: HD-GYP domain-containing protein [Solirubrobacterales bacterium]
MLSSSQRSPSTEGPEETAEGLDPIEAERVRMRMVEAMRRAEIASMLAGASEESQLGRTLCEELGEAYDAEICLLAEFGTTEGVREIGSVGLDAGGRQAALAWPELGSALGEDRAQQQEGTNLYGVGGETALSTSYHADDERRIVLVVIRLNPVGFDEAERALLENVTVSTGGALERLWALEQRNELIDQLKEALVGVAESLANALEARDDYTAEHATEVADLAYRVGVEMGFDSDQLEDLRYAAIFHDIGKIAIPDAILNKQGPLTPDEREVMMSHTTVGERILAPITVLSDDVRKMVRHDHERWDGHGYPDGLGGQQIPLGARIIFVVDSYHAMTSDRPYRKSIGEKEAIQELRRHSGTQFDPAVVSAFLAIVS